ncbi:RNA-binding protein 39-like isoform X2 [Zingiber officinale]|uniref:RNA-binding protein 39-like isoform X2 n=1 Tax=Zingiber officinale TaxID=94328 RepID=UPI001C4AF134|nr:RNA-binding protein 39-like isoform X2 [Zingiber officinale]
MDFDEYEYLEKAVEEPEARKDKDRSGSRRHKDRGEDGEGRASKRSRPEEQNGDKRDRVERERDNDRAKDRRKSGRDSEKERDKDRDYRSREREYKDRDKGRERDSGKERERGKEKDKKRERERDKEKERDRSASRSRRDAERDRSASRSRRDAESEMETARSKERREPELEREIHERESRRVKDKKDAEPEVDPERDQRTVFAYQMPLKANERDAYEFFSQAGKVRDVRLIMDRNSRRSKGVGYIEFYDVMSVPLAIALSGQLLLGQPVMVKPSEAEKNLVQSTATAAGVAGAAERKIYVGNLHYNITEEQLRQIFEPFGTVELVQLPLDETGHCRGYGFIQFAQLDHVKAAQSLNGKLDIAGRIIKVSAVTDHVTVQETGTSAVDFDDEDGGGLSLNARSRAMLMQKLDRTGTASSIAESLGVPILNGAVPIQQPLSVPALSINPSMISVQQIPATVETSECLLLTNMFDPSTETEPDFELDIKEDVQEECSKYGRVKHIFVDKNSNGHVYLRFESVTAASICQRAMQGRWFAGRSVSATYMRQQDYEAKVGRD